MTRWERRKRNERKRSRERHKAKLEGFVPKQGDNFRFVAWGGLEDLKLWRKQR